MNLYDRFDTEEMQKLTAKESMAMRRRLIDAMQIPGMTYTNSDAALIALAELLVQTALLTTDGNRAKSRDLMGSLIDRLLDSLTTDEAIAHMRETMKKYPNPTVEELRSKGLVP